MNQTKHQQVISYIESLTVGEKVSVRQLARELGVSEGTVYRAIKEAENQGYVTSIPKVGTLRIEKNQDRTIDSLTYHELNLLLEGRFLSGKKYADQVPKSYLVASRQEDLDHARLSPQSLVITTERGPLIEEAIRRGQPLLLAGDARLDAWADVFQKDGEQIVLACPYEIFELISLINQTIFERVKHRDLITVYDIMTEAPDTLTTEATALDYYELSNRCRHTRFPVLDANKKVVGIVSAQNILGQDKAATIGSLMVPNPLTAQEHDMLSYLGRLFVLEGAELVPVLNEDHMLTGVVSRQDVIDALQSTQKQPQYGDTVDNVILSGFQLISREPDVVMTGVMTEFMLDDYGRVSIGNICTLTSGSAVIAARLQENLVCQVVQENVQIFMPVQEGVEVTIATKLYPMADKSFQAVMRLTSEEGLHALATATLVQGNK